MTVNDDRFAGLSTRHAPGQEGRQGASGVDALIRGGMIEGRLVDFSHGDVDAFPPTPGSLERLSEAVALGASQAYTEYRGASGLRKEIAGKLAEFTGAPISAEDEVIITPGTQGALFLAAASVIRPGDRVAIVQPDYFANNKIVRFLGGEVVPVRLHFRHGDTGAGLDLDQLKAAFESGAKLFIFSNPNNPTGVVYSDQEIAAISALAAAHKVTVIADQLYSRLVYPGEYYGHIRSLFNPDHEIVTIMGPSKTESLSGYRLGVAIGPAPLIDRMEQLQAIVSLRAAGYNQAVLRTWFSEPAGWLAERIRLHQEIRDDLLEIFRSAGLETRTPQAGSYLFPRLPSLVVEFHDFVVLLRRQAGVIVTPGTEFGPFPDSVRLNFSQDRSAAVAAGRRIAEMVRRYGE